MENLCKLEVYFESHLSSDKVLHTMIVLLLNEEFIPCDPKLLGRLKRDKECSYGLILNKRPYIVLFNIVGYFAYFTNINKLDEV